MHGSGGASVSSAFVEYLPTHNNRRLQSKIAKAKDWYGKRIIHMQKPCNATVQGSNAS